MTIPSSSTPGCRGNGRLSASGLLRLALAQDKPFGFANARSGQAGSAFHVGLEPLDLALHDGEAARHRHHVREQRQHQDRIGRDEQRRRRQLILRRQLIERDELVLLFRLRRRLCAGPAAATTSRTARQTRARIRKAMTYSSSER